MQEALLGMVVLEFRMRPLFVVAFLQRDCWVSGLGSLSESLPLYLIDFVMFCISVGTVLLYWYILLLLKKYKRQHEELLAMLDLVYTPFITSTFDLRRAPTQTPLLKDYELHRYALLCSLAYTRLLEEGKERKELQGVDLS
jgi:hypothetical protein